MNSNYSLLIEEVGQRFIQISGDSVQLLQSQGTPYETYAESIEKVMGAVKEDSLIKVALVGQYSAGKSTIISALTGNKDIKIDADIATDVPEDYDWNGVILTDTPGLYTERKDHDARTYEAIKVSDLLLYVLTSDLFDDIVLENFVKLAYEDAYRSKMMLVVNKMSMEQGEFAELRSNYLETLKTSLMPHDLGEFSPVFIDAADYIEGVEDDFQELLESSHFDELVTAINGFVHEKGLLGKMDTPIRQVVSEIGKALTENSTEGSREFFLLLERIENRVKKSIEKSQNNLNIITSDMRSAIVTLGNQLTSLIGGENVDFEGEQKKVETEIRQLIEDANNRLEDMLKAEREELTEQIEDILNSDLADSFFSSVEIDTAHIKGGNVDMTDISNLQKNFKAINNIVEKATGGILKFSNNAAGGFVKSSAMRGSDLHKGIYQVGKFFGHSFKPWQAVNAAKFLTNVAKVAGPVLAIAGVLLEITGHVKEEQNLRKVLQAKNECSSSFVALAKSTQEQFQKQFDEYKNNSYNVVLEEISNQRKEAQTQNQSTLAFHHHLQGNLEELESLIKRLAM
ncbi:GTPase [Neobacillus sp. 114]|uniref:GTPase n=1 Tax=Neobacillus sp. 114 TaxID=3048535 RepID=UPI0024C2955C|nr:GTPase [Neobacillus sp. 114]